MTFRPQRAEARDFPAPRIALGSILLLSTLILFPSATYFFQGDSLYWLDQRFQSGSEVARSLISLDPHGWYRPLSHRLIPSLLYPLFGLQAEAYHGPVFLLYLALCLLAYRLYTQVCDSSLCALLATAFLALHSYAVFVTFDFYAEPDLLYAFFGMLSILSFGSWLRHRRTRSWVLSVVWFWLALLSKEPAILLPAMLAWLFVLVPMRSERRMLALRGLRPHGVLLSAYLLFVFAWLRAGSLGSNVFSLSSSFTLVTENLNRLMLWSFNLPWSWHSGYRHLPVIGWLVLGFVAVAVILGWLRIAWKGTAERRLLWLALGWFGIAAIPLLFLLELKPYYLLFPLLGFSLAVGVGLTELARSFRGERARTLVLVAFLGTQAILSARLSDQDRRQHPLLGGSALLNEQVLREVRQAIPDGAATHLIILDSPGSSAYWSFAQGGLFRLGLSDPKLRVSFASLGVDFSSIPADTRTYVFRLADGVLSQVTESFRNNPSQFLSSEEDFNYSPLEYDLIRVSPSRVVAGRDRYRLEVPGWKNQIVELQFRLDDGPIGIVRVQLDATAGTSYYVSDQTPRGRYRFFAVRLPGQPIWRRSSEAVVAVE